MEAAPTASLPIVGRTALELRVNLHWYAGGFLTFMAGFVVHRPKHCTIYPSVTAMKTKASPGREIEVEHIRMHQS